MASLAPKFAGISHERIENAKAVCSGRSTSPDAPSTEYLHKGGVLRGKGLFQAGRVPARRSRSRTPSTRWCSPPAAPSTTTTPPPRPGAPRASPPSSPRASSRSTPRTPGSLGVEDGQTGRRRQPPRPGAVPRHGQPAGAAQRHLDAVPLPGDAQTNELTTDAGDAVTGTGEYKVASV